MKRLALLLITLLVLGHSSLRLALAQGAAPTPTQASGKYDDRLRAFEDFVRQQMQRDRIPGMTVGFVKDGFVWTRGFGYADLENRVAASAESSYQTASVLKGMTAVAVIQLAEQGKINLDAEVQAYVPYYPKKKWPITIRQLLGHTGGISHYKYEWEKYNREPKTTKETIAIFADYDLVAEPGTKFSYSTYGYDLLGAVIEEVSKQSYGDYMREHVWQPTGMSQTMMDNPLDFIPNRVRGYQYYNGAEKNAIFGEIKNAEYINFSTRFAAGGARSTVPDMLRFAQALNAGKLLSRESMAHIYQPQVTRDGHLNGFPGTGGYATGALLFQFNGRFCANYSGGQMGTSTAIFNFPTANLTIAVGMNIQSRRVLAYVQRLYQLLMNEPLFASVYTGDRVGDDYVTAMQNIFENGLSYYEIQRRPLAASAAEAAAAFAYFNKYVNAEALHANRAEVLKKINEAQQPFVGQPFTKLGSYMAAKLGDRRGVRSLENYHAAGAISFFNDYIEMYKKESGYPKELQFNEGFEQTVTRWERSWRKTNNAYVRGLSITPETDFDVAARRLRETFKGAEVYPDLGLNSNNTDAGGLNFFNTVQQLLLKGELAKAASAGQLAVELYPQSELANTALALVKISSGDKAQALMLLKEAAAINPEGMASADNLGNLAQNWAAADNADGALQVLNLAAELYPRAANLYEITGELYLRKGQKGKAAEFYRTALQLDPNSKNARSALENLAHE